MIHLKHSIQTIDLISITQTICYWILRIYIWQMVTIRNPSPSWVDVEHPVTTD